MLGDRLHHEGGTGASLPQGVKIVVVVLPAMAFFLGPASGLSAQSTAPPPRGRSGAEVTAVQSYASDAFLDPTAEALFRSAQAKWSSIDTSVVRYTALIKQRIAAGIRTPLKDRTIYRNESAVRAFWDRDHDALIQVLGARAQHPGRDQAKRDGELNWLEELTIDSPFEPGGDRLLFGFMDQNDPEVFDPDESDFWIAHPLARGADTLYRFQSGDTLTLSLPDGRRLRTVQLDVLPREADVHRLSGTLWIEPEEGALVRAVYRLSRELDVIRDIPEVRAEAERGEFDMVPGVLKPWIFDMSLVAIDYSLWDFRVWLPRSMRVEGKVEVGVLKMPISVDLSYDIESVTLVEDLAQENAATPTEERHFGSREEAMAFLAQLLTDEDGVQYKSAGDVTRTSGGRTTRFLIPMDESILEESRHLPPPIWDDAPGFTSEEELQTMFEDLADLPPIPMQGAPWDLNWGWAREDLLRYNRVEGPAVGGRFDATFGSFLGPVDFRASGFFGFGDLEPKARLELERSGVTRRVALGGYRELRPTDTEGRFLGLGNSLNALLFGRDDGEYFMATGADLVWRSPEAARETFRFRAYAERQDPVYRMTEFAVVRAFDQSWEFRPNVEADPAEEIGGELHLRPWWGTDPEAPQVGLELYGQAATWRTPDSTTTTNYGRASAVLRVAFPIADPRWRVGMEMGGGTTWGDAPAQRAWFLGGPRTLRGYEAGVRSGSSFLRSRLEVARVYSQVVTVSAFGDAGWAGHREHFHNDDLLYAVGLGTSLLDGLIRLDVSQGLTGPKRFRVDLYVDAIL
jgi:hypothetical protein